MNRIVPLLVALPLSIASQSPESVCAAIRELTVGIWAEYELSGVGGMEAHGTMRNAIVGTEVRGDTTFWWHESRVTAPEGSLIVKSLVPGYPFETRQVRELVMKMGEEPAMRMPDYMLAAMQADDRPPDRAFATIDECVGAEDLGWEEVDTPAGAVRAWHSRTTMTDGEPVDVWMTSAVPFGIVHLLGGSVELLLTGHGTGAVTAITETPRELER